MGGKGSGGYRRKGFGLWNVPTKVIRVPHDLVDFILDKMEDIRAWKEGKKELVSSIHVSGLIEKAKPRVSRFGLSYDGENESDE